MLAFLIAKHSIFHVFEVNLAPFSFIFMSNPLFKCFCRNGRKREKNQANWMRIGEVVQIVVIVATTSFIVSTMT